MTEKLTAEKVFHVTFDTNVSNYIAAPDLYNYKDQKSISVIRECIISGRVSPYVSQGSMSLEALGNEDRINTHIRKLAGQIHRRKDNATALPSAERQQIFDILFLMGFKALRTPRLALGSMVDMKENCWADDLRFPQKTRQQRFSNFIRHHPHTGSSELRKLGLELLEIHSQLIADNPSGSLSPFQKINWQSGLIKEYDNPKKYSSKKEFLNQCRRIFSEWADLDIQASHYAYGLDYLCTTDTAKNAGTAAVMHPEQIKMKNQSFAFQVLSPEKLVALLEE